MHVRLRLVDLLSSLHSADREGKWTDLTSKKRKRSDRGSQEAPTLSVRQALVKMVNDSDHAVRMHVAVAITSLFVTCQPMPHLSGPGSQDSVVLLSSQSQEETFQQVLEMLRLAHILSEGLDELSAEDESVNRVASRLYTLLLMGCVSPVCERQVVRELVVAIGQGDIDEDLVLKVRQY